MNFPKELEAQINECVLITEQFNKAKMVQAVKDGQNPLTVLQQSVKTNVNRVINSYGRFYGLRSKYDGKGNLREPIKASAA